MGSKDLRKDLIHRVFTGVHQDDFDGVADALSDFEMRARYVGQVEGRQYGQLVGFVVGLIAGFVVARLWGFF